MFVVANNYMRDLPLASEIGLTEARFTTVVGRARAADHGRVAGRPRRRHPANSRRHSLGRPADRGGTAADAIERQPTTPRTNSLNTPHGGENQMRINRHGGDRAAAPPRSRRRWRSSSPHAATTTTRPLTRTTVGGDCNRDGTGSNGTGSDRTGSDGTGCNRTGSNRTDSCNRTEASTADDRREASGTLKLGILG